MILDCQLSEELKWGVPTYTYKKSNIVLIHAFKKYCALLFPKGVLLEDPEKILIQQTQNVQYARQIRFSNSQEIIKQKKVIIDYIFEGREVENLGLKVTLKQTSDDEIPADLQLKLDKNTALKNAFETLTPERQRAYLFYFSQAKKSKTRTARVEHNIDQILAGKGLAD